MIWIREDLRDLFRGLAFEDWFTLGQRTIKRSAGGARETSWFERAGRGFYVKTHGGAGWKELAKCWLQGKRPIVDARTEARALERCAAAGVRAPKLAAWGVEGANPATRRSFLVTEAIEGAERLSELAAGALARPAASARRHALARALGELVGRLHAAELAHQDLYLTHFLVRAENGAAPELFLLDLHRARPRAARAAGWRVKDLAALQNSAAALGATHTDALRFRRGYERFCAPPPQPALERRLRRLRRRGLAPGA